MKGQIVKAAIISAIIVLSIRIVLDLFPDEPFWHFRELLDLPGGLIQGFLGFILYALSYDLNDRPAGIDRAINFIWLYAVVFGVAWLVLRRLRRGD